MENMAAILLVENFKLLVNIHEWIAHEQFTHLPQPPKTSGLLTDMRDDSQMAHSYQ